MAKIKDALNDLAKKLSKARRLEVPSVENMIRQQEVASAEGKRVKAEKV